MTFLVAVSDLAVLGLVYALAYRHGRRAGARYGEAQALGIVRQQMREAADMCGAMAQRGDHRALVEHPGMIRSARLLDAVRVILH